MLHGPCMHEWPEPPVQLHGEPSLVPIFVWVAWLWEGCCPPPHCCLCILKLCTGVALPPTHGGNGDAPVLSALGGSLEMVRCTSPTPWGCARRFSARTWVEGRSVAALHGSLDDSCQALGVGGQHGVAHPRVNCWHCMARHLWQQHKQRLWGPGTPCSIGWPRLHMVEPWVMAAVFSAPCLIWLSAE